MSLGAIITLREAMKTMRRGEPFSIEFVTCDEKRNTGGEFILVESARLASFKEKKENTSTSPVKGSSRGESHTVNIMIFPSKEKRRIHPRLITMFNNNNVVY